MPMTYNNVTIQSNMDTFEFGRDENNATRAFLFGIKNGFLHRYTFEVDLE